MEEHDWGKDENAEVSADISLPNMQIDEVSSVSFSEPAGEEYDEAFDQSLDEALDTSLDEMDAFTSEELSDEPQNSWQQGVSETMRDAGGTIAAGFSALKEVRQASRNAEEASRDVSRMQADLEEIREKLAWRTDIERNYPQIVERESANRAAAQAAIDDAQARIDLASAQRDELNRQLEALRGAHEEQLLPYRNVMEAAKSRSDDASRALADARRNVRAAEGQVSDAERQRNQRNSQAERAYESTKDRLRRVESELDRLQHQGDGSPAAITKLQQEVIAEHAHVDVARDQVSMIAAEEERNVDALKNRLWQQQQTLEAAERVASEAKAEANARKDEYDKLYKQATAEEDALKARVDGCNSDISQAQTDITEATERVTVAQHALDEAQDVHDNPAGTEALRQQIVVAQAELAQRSAEADELAGHERELRASTRGQRIAFIAVVAAVVALVILLVWLFFFSK